MIHIPYNTYRTKNLNTLDGLAYVVMYLRTRQFRWILHDLISSRYGWRRKSFNETCADLGYMPDNDTIYKLIKEEDKWVKAQD